ncbi:probable G-protein coupled receptor 141 [Apteryx mantelli]|uniref:Probable G-protein coupled receptor 141 n=1 Tax=Apteryx mantelli TaxID=2696672 RepID=A0A8B7IYY4_9AVES|nr:PREDICTED: probable G-protein coupled receptor 141 [Apteryx mantelli mantelli]XP_025943718.1 probable G-protein coupled receptor 141 [Apteryx rowi]XP_025943719.1 probable G-protein coupled receptor 141 [Apteryx rowi]
MPNTSLTQQTHPLNETALEASERLRSVLIALYSIDLAGGTLGVIVMSHHLFQRRSQSVMTIIIISLLVLHTLLLFSIPFRLSYYILREWKFGKFACKLVSAMIYLHMYTTFAFYIAIIIIRLFRLEFKKCYTTTWVTAVWLLGALVISPVFLSYYGTSKAYDSSECFQFHQELQETPIVIVNYCLVGILVVICTVLTTIQLSVIYRLAVKYWPDIYSHVEFRAQAKSFFFILVTLVCFMPHHVFRIYYIQNSSQDKDHKLIPYNEIFLALTTMCCLDMLCFIAGIAH